METTVFHNANVLDCTGRDPYLGTVVVAGDRIRAVGPVDQVSTPRDATSVDLSGMTLMPGLIDAHAHVALMGGHMGGFEADYPGAIFPLEVAKNIEDYL
ncbi:MAG: amidohydrolase family protein, partial [Dehalococcoidia bacterium]